LLTCSASGNDAIFLAQMDPVNSWGHKLKIYRPHKGLTSRGERRKELPSAGKFWMPGNGATVDGFLGLCQDVTTMLSTKLAMDLKIEWQLDEGTCKVGNGTNIRTHARQSHILLLCQDAKMEDVLDNSAPFRGVIVAHMCAFVEDFRLCF